MTIAASFFVLLLTYDEGMRESLSTGKPLVVFVECQPYDVPGAVVCERKAAPGFPKGTIKIGVPVKGKIDWRITVVSAQTDASSVRDIVAGLDGRQE